MQRFCLPARRLVVAYTAAAATSVRFPSTKYSKKVSERADLEDERWLEAEMDENINGPEERYAHQLEMERIKNMIAAMGKEHSEKLEDAKKERNKEIDALKGQIKTLESRIKDLQK